MYLGIIWKYIKNKQNRKKKQECWFSVYVGKGGCDKTDDKKVLTLTGTEDCLIVWVFGVTVEGATIMQHAITKSYWNQNIGKSQILWQRWLCIKKMYWSYIMIKIMQNRWWTQFSWTAIYTLQLQIHRGWRDGMFVKKSFLRNLMTIKIKDKTKKGFQKSIFTAQVTISSHAHAYKLS